MNGHFLSVFKLVLIVDRRIKKPHNPRLKSCLHLPHPSPRNIICSSEHVRVHRLTSHA